MSSQPAVAVLRAITRELRLAQPPGTKLANSRPLAYIVDQYRKHQLTQEQYCKHTEEMTFLASTYRTYLESQRKWKENNDEYHAKGERTVEDTARMVGFKLPQDPEEPTTRL